jgi:hypothetical protein
MTGGADVGDIFGVRDSVFTSVDPRIVGAAWHGEMDETRGEEDEPGKWSGFERYNLGAWIERTVSRLHYGYRHRTSREAWRTRRRYCPRDS